MSERLPTVANPQPPAVARGCGLWAFAAAFGWAVVVGVVVTLAWVAEWVGWR